jgi:hypothetical protein
MLFKVLKLFGLDVRAKVAAAKSVIEQRAEEVAQYAGQTVQTAAVIAALSALAGVLGAMAVGVGLYALYRVDADTFGVYAGLGGVWRGARCGRPDPVPHRLGKGAVSIEPSHF